MDFKENIEKDWRFVREQVFVREQGFKKEFDDIDAKAMHVTAYDNGNLIGCGRVYPKDGTTTYHLGRLAILKAYRKHGYGSSIVQRLELEATKLGALCILLDAQEQAIQFYEKQGYTICGKCHMDEQVPHYEMMKMM